MLSTNYEFPARAKLNAQRPRLLSAWTLAGFALAVLAVLVIIFPKHELLKEAMLEKIGDPLTANYITNLLRTDPGNLELRLLLAQHKIFLGEMKEVPDLLEPVLKSQDDDLQSRARLVEYKYYTKLCMLSNQQSAEQETLMLQRRNTFFLLASHAWAMPTLVYLASQANFLDERGIAGQLYLKIKRGPRQMSAEWYADMAARALGKGHYELASVLYFIARQEARLLVNQREYLMAGIKALMANSMFVDAMVSADLYLGNLEDDYATLFFLAQTARSANDTVRADKYAKKMLHLSSLEPALDWFDKLQLSPINSAYAASDELQSGDAVTMRPYDSKTYTLAYEIFLGNRNQADAFRVAEAAVRQVPADLEWRKRLAHVAEWLGKPGVALEQWHWLMNHGDGEEAIKELLRLAPGQGDYQALIDVWQHIAAKRSLDDAQWRALADLYEQVGTVAEGIKYLQAQYARNHRVLLLELAAHLSQRSGDDEGANKIYLLLIKNHGMNTDRLLKVTAWYMQNGQYQKAFDLLQKNRNSANASDYTLLKLLADLAWQLQNDAVATENYQLLAASDNLAKEDFGRLIFLLGPSHQEEAAKLAELAYHKFADREMLLKALEIHAAQHDLAAQRRLFGEASSGQEGSLNDDSRFLLLRAQFYQTSGNYTAARADLFRAAVVAPNDVNTANAILWFLIEAHEHPALREEINRILSSSNKPNQAYWGVLAAAYEELGQPARAIKYFDLQLNKMKDDLLWLMSYAEALEQNHQPGLAWKVRQHAWKSQRSRLKGKSIELPLSAEMLAVARLAIANAPHDPALGLIRSVLRQDRLLKRDAAADQLTNELVLAWVATDEQNANAKAWLWKRYGVTLNRPLWADVMVALADNDTKRLNHLLQEQADGISTNSRHDAALALDQTRYAQSIVFEGLENDPADNEAHQRLTDDVIAAASQVNFEFRDEQIGSLHNVVQHTEIEIPVTNRLRLALDVGETRQSSDAPLLLIDPPARERIAGVSLLSRNGFGQTKFVMLHRNEYDNTNEFSLTHDMEISSGLNLQINAEANAEATESNDLRVFGMRNQFDASMNYAFGKSQFVRVQPIYARYFTQKGEYLGNGSHISLEMGHHIRSEYPDWSVRLTGDFTKFDSSGTSNLILPENADQYGVCMDFGNSYKLAYTRALRPFFDYCLTDNSVTGQGYKATVGVSAPVAGHDSLSVMYLQEVGGLNITDGQTTELTVRYRYFFDRY
jgi:hypothetical protein